jgi:AcrR family transcriptional regulator
MSDTRTKILELADGLFRSRGYTGFSYRDIAMQLGVKTAAIHYHFPGQADLGIAVIDRFRDLLKRRTGRFMGEGGDALIQLEAYFRFNQRQCADACVTICPLGSVATAYETMPDAMRERAALLLKETLAWLQRVLEVGREQGVFHFAGDPRSRAVAVMATLQGALQLARVSERAVLDTAIAQIRSDLAMTA